MTRAGRAFLGAAVGALLTLAIHPLSRTFMLGPLLPKRLDTVTRCLDSSASTLPPPRSLNDASLWVNVGAEGLREKGLDTRELNTLAEITRVAGIKDTDNAFWPQMRAVFLSANGRMEEAQAEWRRAANLGKWDDRQTVRLKTARDRIVNRTGGRQAWQLGFVYYERSEAAATLIEEFGRSLVSKLDTTSPRSVALRYSTMLNGHVLQNGSRSIRVGLHGGNLVELASYPADMARTRSPKRLWAAMTQLTGLMRARGDEDKSRRAFRAYQDNEAWQTMTHMENPDENTRTACFVSIFSSTINASLLAGLLIGGLCFVVGRFWESKVGDEPRFDARYVVLCGWSIGALVGLLGHSWVAGCATGLIVLFVVTGPNHSRPDPPEELGPLYSFMLFSVGASFVLTLSCVLAGLGIGARALAPSVGGVAPFIGDPTSYMGVTGIILSLLCIIAPAWAVVHRYGTPKLFARTLRRFGSILSISCVTISVVIGPLSVYVDRRCEEFLMKVVENEPIYYLYP